MEQLYIDKLTEDQISTIGGRLRPGHSSYSGFLGANESLREVIYEDVETLRKLGLTPDQIADKLEDLIENSAKSNDKFKVNIISYRGMQEDPFKEQWVPATYSNLDITITNKKTGKSVRFGGPVVGLIRNYQFFEGKEVPYRLDPEIAAEVLELLNK